MTGCQYAHGEEELVNRATYKTTMCRNIADKGSCDREKTCHFAHSKVGEISSHT